MAEYTGPKVIAVGTTCYITTLDNCTVQKGHQVWFNGKLVFDYGEQCEDRLAREAIIYTHLGEHPRILTCFGLEEVHPNVHSLRLEMAPLGSIRTFTQETAGNPPSIQQRLQMALDVAMGLTYMHSQGVMSCDLSCSNIFVFEGLRTKLGDFGAALLAGFDFKQDQSHETRYQLPLRGREYDNLPLLKRELFALGSALYEILAWERPFPKLNDDEIDRKYAREEFPSLEGNIARPIIWKCWTEVYGTAQEVTVDLEALKTSTEK